MRFSKLVVVGLVGIVTLAANAAFAQETPAQIAAASGVSFTDTINDMRSDRFALHVTGGDERRFASLASVSTERERRSNDTRYELAVVASAGAGFDVSLSQRGGVGYDASGDIDRQSRASELRLGKGLRGMRDDAPSLTPTWYFFAASEDEALIWRPGQQRNAFGGSAPGFALQDRVEIGDLQAGITYEFRGIQASLAYVEREINVRSGAQNFSQDERFAGFTLTMRR
ncbi:MAG TPA: hypothetical protein PLN53_07420 [Terricaulis sp.]|nr:hypothetical protein [Terricaulis sp.]